MHDQIYSIRPSKILCRCFVLTAVVAYVLIFILTVSLLVKLIFCLVLTMYLAKIYVQHVSLSSRQAIAQIRCLAGGGWQIETSGKIVFAARLLGDSTLTRNISILRFKLAATNQIKSLIILADSLAEDRYRQLLVTVKVANLEKNSVMISLDKPHEACEMHQLQQK